MILTYPGYFVDSIFEWAKVNDWEFFSRKGWVSIETAYFGWLKNQFVEVAAGNSVEI